MFENQNIGSLIESIAVLDKVDVFFTGEPGTGKTHFAERVHKLSPRARKPFISVNCAELSPTLIEAELFGAERGSYTGAVAARAGKFEAASGGTLFLDEIGELSFDLQAKLLKAVEEKRITRVGSNMARSVDVRLIFATNQPLDKFREDFKGRLLCAYPIRLQPLSERKAEIPQLAKMFLQQMNREYERQFMIAPETLKKLQTRRWTGNIRELRGTVRRLCVQALMSGIALSPSSKLEIKLDDDLSGNEQNPAAQNAWGAEQQCSDKGLDNSKIIELNARCAVPNTDLSVARQDFFHLRRREDELFSSELQILKDRGFNCEQMATAMGLSRRTFFRRLKRSRLSVAEAGRGQVRTVENASRQIFAAGRHHSPEAAASERFAA